MCLCAESRSASYLPSPRRLTKTAQHPRSREWVLQMQSVETAHYRESASDTGRGS